jgi:hypothetical protein
MDLGLAGLFFGVLVGAEGAGVGEMDLGLASLLSVVVAGVEGTRGIDGPFSFSLDKDDFLGGITIKKISKWSFISCLMSNTS